MSFLSMALLQWLFLYSESFLEDQVRQYIENGFKSTENRALLALADLIYENYLDPRGVAPPAWEFSIGEPHTYARKSWRVPGF